MKKLEKLGLEAFQDFNLSTTQLKTLVGGARDTRPTDSYYSDYIDDNEDTYYTDRNGNSGSLSDKIS